MRKKVADRHFKTKPSVVMSRMHIDLASFHHWLPNHCPPHPPRFDIMIQILSTILYYVYLISIILYCALYTKAGNALLNHHSPHPPRFVIII